MINMQISQKRYLTIFSKHFQDFYCCLFFCKTQCTGLERWLNNQEQLLFLKRVKVSSRPSIRLLRTTCNSSLRGSNTLFWTPWAPTDMYHNHTETHRHTHKSKMNLKKKQYNKICMPYNFDVRSLMKNIHSPSNLWKKKKNRNKCHKPIILVTQRRQG